LHYEDSDRRISDPVTSLLDAIVVRAEQDNLKRKESRNTLDREQGKVKWFNNAKGYGFTQRVSGDDICVHHSAIQAEGYKSPSEGETVEFTVTKGPKGLQAENVAKL
jgi:cold shock protein